MASAERADSFCLHNPCLVTVDELHHTTRVHDHPQRTPHPPLLTLAADSPGSLEHFTNEGWLTHVVNPYNYGVQGSDTQAFVVLDAGCLP